MLHTTPDNAFWPYTLSNFPYNWRASGVAFALTSCWLTSFWTAFTVRQQTNSMALNTLPIVFMMNLS
jgi:hypothetical protein